MVESLSTNILPTNEAAIDHTRLVYTHQSAVHVPTTIYPRTD